MPDHKRNPYRFHFGRSAVLLALLAVPFIFASAQGTVQDSTPQPESSDQSGRIVESRPPLYTFKKDAHPLTWMEWGIEPMFRSADNGFVRRLIARREKPEKPSGVKIDLDGMGAGSGFGPEVTFYNKNFLGRGIDVEVPLLYTYNRYELFRFSGAVPIIGSVDNKAAPGLTFDLGTWYGSRARDDMFTIGNDAPLTGESQVRFVSRNVAAGFSARFNEELRAGLHETYRNVGVTKPIWGKNAQERLRDEPIPGLLTGGTILSTVFVIDHDREEKTEIIDRNNIEHLEVSFNRSAGNGDFRYWKYHLEAQHFFPISEDHRTAIALRAFMETNQRTHGDVPFFDMPALGTWETLRGYENFRFRDRSALALTAEYRYRIWRLMDWAFFLDEGQVAARPRDFGWDRFHPGYGIRWFIYPKPSFPVTIDFSRSPEKSHRLYINFVATF